MKKATNRIIVVGNYGGGHHTYDIYDSKGLAPTIKAGNNHGTGVAILVYEQDSNKALRELPKK